MLKYSTVSSSNEKHSDRHNVQRLEREGVDASNPLPLSAIDFCVSPVDERLPASVAPFRSHISRLSFRAIKQKPQESRKFMNGGRRGWDRLRNAAVARPVTLKLTGWFTDNSSRLTVRRTLI